MINEKTPFVLYGGDYNPDQWTKETIAEDMRLFKLANINTLTLPVFSWALLQTDEDTYNFEWLDEILDTIKENGMYVCMATATAVQPTWMSKKYPEMLITDFQGRKRKFGGRVNFCPNSEKYREFSVKLARKLAERYKDYENIIAWHISNEYANYCYCDNCENKFKEWVKDRYKTIEAVNKAWNMNFWGHTLYSFDEIVAPSDLSEMWNGYGKQCTTFQGMAIDYNRFMSDSILGCYLGEYNVLKEVTPDIKITTNLMSTYKPLDYFKWAKYMDIVSWDNYPALTTPISDTAFRHALMRGVKNGDPFMLIEQTPSQQNWQAHNSVKRPGVMRLHSYQAMAHGADTVMFFQMRQSIGACEKYHAAVISHAGHENTRIFKECADLGEELTKLGDTILDSRFKSKVAIVFDWDNWWAVEFSSGPSVDLRYVEQIEKYYKAFHNLNVSVDIVEPNGDFSDYSVVIAPVLYMLKKGVSENIKNFVRNGGTFLTTYFSGYVDESDLVQVGGYPAELRDMLGLWIEEIDALTPDMGNSINLVSNIEHMKNKYDCGIVCDVINLEGATPLAVYGSDFYKDRAVLTSNKYGEGLAYYIGSSPEQSFLNDFALKLATDNNLLLDIEDKDGVEVTVRHKDNFTLTFVLNHNEEEITLALDDKEYVNLLNNETVKTSLTLEGRGVAILKANTN